MSAPQSATKLRKFETLSDLNDYLKRNRGKGYFVACKNLLGTGKDGVARFEYTKNRYFALYIMICEKQEVNNYCVSGKIDDESVKPLQSLPCYKESLTDSELDNIKSQLEQKFENIGESLEDYSTEERSFYSDANVTMECKL